MLHVSGNHFLFQNGKRERWDAVRRPGVWQGLSTRTIHWVRGERGAASSRRSAWPRVHTSARLELEAQAAQTLRGRRVWRFWLSAAREARFRCNAVSRGKAPARLCACGPRPATPLGAASQHTGTLGCAGVPARISDAVHPVRLSHGGQTVPALAAGPSEPVDPEPKSRLFWLARIQTYASAARDSLFDWILNEQQRTK